MSQSNANTDGVPRDTEGNPGGTATRSQRPASVAGNPSGTMSDEFAEIVAQATRSTAAEAASSRTRSTARSDPETQPGHKLITTGEARRLVDAKTEALKKSVIVATGNEIRRLEVADQRISSRLDGLETDIAALKLTASQNNPELVTEVQTLRTNVNSLLEARDNPEAIPDTDDRFGKIGQRLSDLEETTHRLETQMERLSAAIEAHTQLAASALKAAKDPTVGEGSRRGSPPDKSERRPSESRSRRSRRESRRSRSRRHRYGGDDDDPSHSSGSDDDRTDSGTESDRSDRTQDERGGVFARPRGPSVRGLKTLRPTNRDYTRLLDYRRYRLRKRNPLEPGEIDKVKDRINQILTSCPELRFDGTDPILVLDFLATLASEADLVTMSEEQAFVALPRFLRGLAKDQFETVKGTSRREGGVHGWPEAVQYLLRSYATNENIQGAVHALKLINQRDGESELDYSSRLSRAERRCGNPHFPRDRMTHFIDGLDPAIKPLVHSYREERPRATFLDIVYKARAEGEAKRALSKTRRPSSPILPARSAGRGTRTGRSAAYVAEATSPPRRSLVPYTHSQVQTGEGMYYLGEHEGSWPPPQSMESYSPPLGSETVEEDPSDPHLQGVGDAVMLAQGEKIVPNAPVAYSEYDNQMRYSRPGWVDRGKIPASDNRRGNQYGYSPAQRFICHLCYRKGHVSTTCILPARDLYKVVWNYESLTPEERARVPATSYWRAKALFPDGRAAQPDNQAPQVMRRPHSPNSGPKNHPPRGEVPRERPADQQQDKPRQGN